jgi:hypothetical protein
MVPGCTPGFLFKCSRLDEAKMLTCVVVCVCVLAMNEGTWRHRRRRW